MVITPSSSRTRLLGLALLAAVFVAGGLAGAAFHSVAEARPAAGAQAAKECDGPRGKRDRIIDQVNPTPEQRARIDAIMERRHAQMDAFWNGEGRRMKAIVDSTREEVRAVLTPEQRAEYDRLRAEHRARRERERESGGPGGAPPAAPSRP
ncbi:MAG TPA: hypothetical protein VF746_16425 [Longimicrobium sp.]|jgi:Spy/CpxP family protein refolding chaperone